MKWIWNEQIVALSNAEAHFLGFLKEEFNLARAAKVHSFLKQCLHDLHFMKTRYFSPNLSKLAPADISQYPIYP